MGEISEDEIRWGIVSTGAIAHEFARGLSFASGAVLHAVSSRDGAKARAFADRHGARKAYGSTAELLADPEVRVVYVGTPNQTHVGICLDALEAGKAVLCEKPLALSAREGRMIAERARSRRVFCMEAMWTRFLPAAGRLKELLAEGAIGTPRLITASIGFSILAEPTSRLLDLKQGGGALLDLGVYPISLGSFLFGPPTEAVGIAGLAPTGVDAVNGFALAFENGARGVFSSALNVASTNEAVIHGSHGTIRIDDLFFRPRTLRVRRVEPVRRRDGGEDQARGGAVAALKRSIGPVMKRLVGRGERRIDLAFVGNGYGHQAEEVGRCLRSGLVESPIMPLDESIRILEVMDSLRASWGVRYSGE